MDKVIETFDLILKIEQTSSNTEKATLLWKSYFDLIWNKYPVDFKDPSIAKENWNFRRLIWTILSD